MIGGGEQLRLEISHPASPILCQAPPKASGRRPAANFFTVQGSPGTTATGIQQQHQQRQFKRLVTGPRRRGCLKRARHAAVGRQRFRRRPRGTFFRPVHAIQLSTTHLLLPTRKIQNKNKNEKTDRGVQDDRYVYAQDDNASVVESSVFFPYFPSAFARTETDQDNGPKLTTYFYRCTARAPSRPRPRPTATRMAARTMRSVSRPTPDTTPVVGYRSAAC